MVAKPGINETDRVPDNLVGKTMMIQSPQAFCHFGATENGDCAQNQLSVLPDAGLQRARQVSEHYPMTVAPATEIGAVKSGHGLEPYLSKHNGYKAGRTVKKRQRQPDAANKIGTIPSKGRHPYRPGGCKLGKIFTQEELVGSRVLMWSPADSVYYAGGVKDYNKSTNLHTLLYVDGSKDSVNMKNAIWRVATSDHDDVYPEDFGVKATGNLKREKRRRRKRTKLGASRDELPKSIAETLVNMACYDVDSKRGPQSIANPAERIGHAHTTNGGPYSPNKSQQTNENKCVNPAKGTASFSQGGLTVDAAKNSLAFQDMHKIRPDEKALGEAQKLMASSPEFQVYKVDAPVQGYNVLHSLPKGTKISNVNVTCGKTCIIIKHGSTKSVSKVDDQSEKHDDKATSRLVVVLPEAIHPPSATAKLTKNDELIVFTSLATT